MRGRIPKRESGRELHVWARLQRALMRIAMNVQDARQHQQAAGIEATARLAFRDGALRQRHLARRDAPLAQHLTARDVPGHAQDSTTICVRPAA